MKVKYDKEVDAAYIQMSSKKPRRADYVLYKGKNAIGGLHKKEGGYLMQLFTFIKCEELPEQIDISVEVEK